MPKKPGIWFSHATTCFHLTCFPLVSLASIVAIFEMRYNQGQNMEDQTTTKLRKRSIDAVLARQID